MLPDKRFIAQPKTFWANVRSISQVCGYTNRGAGTIKVPSLAEMMEAMWRVGLGIDHLASNGSATPVGQLLHDYFAYRADVLNSKISPLLMDVERARAMYSELRRSRAPKCPQPTNKQKGPKAGPAYLTCIVNMLLEEALGDRPVNFDPLQLTTVTYNNAPLRTLSRRLDGAFPSPVNPIAIWEIKEYYFTTTFGSRIADGVYETLLDGMELEELRINEGIDVAHMLIIDARDTWWSSGGRPYLCRIIDMLHMGYVNEVLFGSEVLSRIPEIGKEWAMTYDSRLPG